MLICFVRLNVYVNYSVLNRWVCFILIYEIIYFLVKFYFYIFYIDGVLKEFRCEIN